VWAIVCNSFVGCIINWKTKKYLTVGTIHKLNIILWVTNNTFTVCWKYALQVAWLNISQVFDLTRPVMCTLVVLFHPNCNGIITCSIIIRCYIYVNKIKIKEIINWTKLEFLKYYRNLDIESSDVCTLRQSLNIKEN
jgi:hypothetical protein